MPQVFSALVAGLLFGVGLSVSGMMDPAKVLGFLDIAGAWDPTLAFVMGGALAITVPAFILVRRRAAPVLSTVFHIPTRRDIDPRLAIGAALFGLGWGLVGFCPGPALSALSLGQFDVLVFVAAMVAGMMLTRFIPSPP